jgi:hypothetical protein
MRMPTGVKYKDRLYETGRSSIESITEFWSSVIRIYNFGEIKQNYLIIRAYCLNYVCLCTMIASGQSPHV